MKYFTFLFLSSYIYCYSAFSSNMSVSADKVGEYRYKPPQLNQFRTYTGKDVKCTGSYIAGAIVYI